MRALANHPSTQMSLNQEAEALDLLTYMSFLHQLCLQPNGQKQLGKEFNNDHLEQQRYCGLEVNFQLV